MVKRRISTHLPHILSYRTTSKSSSHNTSQHASPPTCNTCSIMHTTLQHNSRIWTMPSPKLTPITTDIGYNESVLHRFHFLPTTQHIHILITSPKLVTKFFTKNSNFKRHLINYFELPLQRHSILTKLFHKLQPPSARIHHSLITFFSSQTVTHSLTPFPPRTTNIYNHHHNDHKRTNKHPSRYIHINATNHMILAIAVQPTHLLSQHLSQKLSHFPFVYKRIALNLFQSTTMPPSPTNLPAQTMETSPVLTKLTRKATSSYGKKTKTARLSPTKLTPKAATDKLFGNTLHKPSPVLKSPQPQGNVTGKGPDTIEADHEQDITVPKINFLEALTQLPPSITYSPDTIYVLCQLRRGKDDTINNTLAKMHNDGSACVFIETLLRESFLARPTTSTLHSHLRIRQIQFHDMKNLTPTYVISFGALLKSDSNNEEHYARYGTPTYKDLQAYIHDFIFERWHTTDNLGLEIPTTALSAIYFLLPPCNYPKHKPMAFIAGLPPQVFGRKKFHTQVITSHLHTLLKPLLPPSSLLHNYCYFIQAFGIQVRRNYTFKEGLQEDVYIACVSNASDYRLLANLLFPSQANPAPLLPILNLPVTFIPIPTRPRQTAKIALSRYYNTVTTIATFIKAKRTMVQKLPSSTTAIFKAPASSTSCKLILDNSNVITYAILHSKQSGIHTRLYVTEHDLLEPNPDETIRSWFAPTTHTTLFFPRAQNNSKDVYVPTSNILQTVVKNLDASLATFAKSIGMTEVPSLSDPLKDKTHIKISSNASTSSDKTSSTSSTMNVTLNPTATVTPQTTTIPQIPLSTSTTPSVNLPPQIPLMNDNTNTKPSYTPQKRPAQSTPSPPPSSPEISSPEPSSEDSSTDETTQVDEHPATNTIDQSPDPSSASSSPSHLDEDDLAEDDQPSTHSVRIDGIRTTLKNAVPTLKRPFVDDNDISKRALAVYEASNYHDAIIAAKRDLLSLADRKIAEYKKYRSKRDKVKSAKKKKKSLKERNPFLI